MENNIKCTKELQLLLFTIDETCYGVDADQVAGLQNYRCDAHTLAVHILLACDPISYAFPRMLAVKDRETYPAILINEPEDIIAIPVVDIRPIPSLLKKTAKQYGVWGVSLKEQRMIVLLDFYKNERFCQSGSSC